MLHKPTIDILLFPLCAPKFIGFTVNAVDFILIRNQNVVN